MRGTVAKIFGYCNLTSVVSLNLHIVCFLGNPALYSLVHASFFIVVNEKVLRVAVARCLLAPHHVVEARLCWEEKCHIWVKRFCGKPLNTLTWLLSILWKSSLPRRPRMKWLNSCAAFLPAGFERGKTGRLEDCFLHAKVFHLVFLL